MKRMDSIKSPEQTREAMPFSWHFWSLAALASSTLGFLALLASAYVAGTGFFLRDHFPEWLVPFMDFEYRSDYAVAAMTAIITGVVALIFLLAPLPAAYESWKYYFRGLSPVRSGTVIERIHEEESWLPITTMAGNTPIVTMTHFPESWALVLEAEQNGVRNRGRISVSRQTFEGARVGEHFPKELA